MGEGEGQEGGADGGMICLGSDSKPPPTSPKLQCVSIVNSGFSKGQ